MRFMKPLVVLIRILAPVLVTLGIGFWTGHWASLIPLHRTLGMMFVLTLWAIAGLALDHPDTRGRALLTIAWGALVAVVGFTQQRLLVGDLHWIVRVLHLVMAMVAMHLAGTLTAARTLVGARSEG